MFKKISIFLIVTTLVGCATKPKDMPPEAPNMKESYQAAMSGQTDNVVHSDGQSTIGNDSSSAKKTEKKAKRVDIPSMTGALQNPNLLERQSDVNQGFPMLPNPQIMLYIYPHFQNELPIHGNWTTFSMYSTNHYALPSEINTGGNEKTY